MTTSKHLKTLLTVAILISFVGCAHKSFIYEPPDYFKIPKGTKICVPMDFEGEEKEYCVVTDSEGAYYSAKTGAAIFASKQRK